MLLTFVLLIPVKKIFSQTLENLYYCNDNQHLFNIYLLSDQRFIGLAVTNRKNYLILYDKHRLPKDTFDLGYSDHNLLQNLHVINDTLIFFVTLNSRGVCSVASDKFKLIQNFAGEEIINNSSTRFTFQLGDFKLGQVRESLKKHSEKIGYKFYFQNKDQTGELPDGFTKRSNYKGSGQLDSKFWMDIKSKRVFIPVETASALVIFDYGKFQSNTIYFPENNKETESWYTYYDHIDNKLYAILFRKAGNNTLYEINIEKEKLLKIKDIPFAPENIINGKFHTIAKNKAINIKVPCHYLIPISGESEKMIVLEEVLIKVN